MTMALAIDPPFAPLARLRRSLHFGATAGVAVDTGRETGALMGRYIAIAALGIALIVGLGAPGRAEATTSPTITALTLSGSPFAEDFAPLPTQVSIHLVLARDAQVRVTVRTPAGVLVRTIQASTSMLAGAYDWTWDGHDDLGNMSPDGQYLIRARAVNSRSSLTRMVRKGLPAIYSANPAAIVVVVDPGHGGRYPGASYDGYSEKTFNLATGLHLRDLLERAGLTVVMTRTTDTLVDNPISDVNGDGLANSYDDLAARNDIANEARGDLNIHVHNNAAYCKCTRGSSVYTNFERTWTPEAVPLATYLQQEQLAVLDQFSDGTYYPIDRGVRKGNYDYMRPYSVVCPTASFKQACQPTYLPRPTLTVSVLMESLFVNNDIELALLKRDDVLVALAAAMYLGIADWLNTRDYGAGYAPIGAQPSTATDGSSLDYNVRVTNRGNATSSGWTLRLGAVPAVSLYDGCVPIGS